MIHIAGPYGQLLNSTSSPHISAYRTQAARWYDYLAKQLAQAKGTRKLVSEFRSLGALVPGQIFLWHYVTPVPQPYFDRYPMTMVFRRSKTHILGMNFHYLHPYWRAWLFDELIPLMQPRPTTDRTKILATYKFLKGVSRFKPFRPCVKLYRTDRVLTQYLWVPAAQWPLTLFLPFENFGPGTSSINVWAESTRKFGGFGT